MYRPLLSYWALVFAGVFGVSNPVQSSGALSFFSAPTGDGFIVADVLPAGRKLVPPTKDNPVCSAAINFGCSFGSIAGERLPDHEAMRDLMVKILADQGYQGNDDKHPPELLLTFQSGCLRGALGLDLEFPGADKLDLQNESAGLSDFSRNLVLENARSPAATKVVELERNDLDVTTACAFDHAAYVAGKAEMLWKTRIATSTAGQSMATAMPDMVALAGPAIGRETTRVIIANPADKREGQVMFGELEV